MSIVDFQMWLAGFLAAAEGQPLTAELADKILAKAKSIIGAPAPLDLTKYLPVQPVNPFPNQPWQPYVSPPRDPYNPLTPYWIGDGLAWGGGTWCGTITWPPIPPKGEL